MKQYKIISKERYSVDSAVEELEREVNKHIQNGWELQGGVSITKSAYGDYGVCQAMIKNEEQK